MGAMNLPYYVALLSAAALHGASHHQPQEFQVFTDRSVRPLNAGRARIRFFASKYIADAAVVEMKTPTGPIRVASPETVVVDLVRFAKAAGGLDHVATVIAELAPLLDSKRLLAAVRRVGDVPNAQRLGYLLDRVRQRQLADAVHAWVTPQVPCQLVRPSCPEEVLENVLGAGWREGVFVVNARRHKSSGTIAPRFRV